MVQNKNDFLKQKMIKREADEIDKHNLRQEMKRI